MTETDIVLVKLDSARMMLAEAKTIQETKSILDIASAAEIYAKRQKMGEDAIRYATSIKVEALAQLGRMLKETPRAKGGQPYQEHSTGAYLVPVEPTLADMGLDKKTSKLAQDIASLPDEQVEKIKDGVLALSKVSSIIKNQKRVIDIEKQYEEIKANAFTPSDDLFDVIVIDPPWPYGTKYDADGRRAANPYPEMSLDEIASIDLPASKDCVLWLWTTHKFMRYSFELIDKWGFRDVAILTWAKNRMGLGAWLRSKSEFCIMAVKGNPKVNLTNQTTILEAPMREHSRKPDEFYQMVDELCVGYKIDWFSRETRQGWAQYGNDTRRFN